MRNIIKKYMLIVFLGLFISQNISAQLQIIVGEQTESSLNKPAPYTNESKSFRIQIIYTATEINAALSSEGLSAGSARNIVGISWDIYSNHGLNDLVNYSVSMGNTSSANLQNHSLDADTEVKSSHTLSPNGTSWHYVDFDASFEWDGTSNIIVDVCWVCPYASLGGSSWIYDDGSGEVRMRWDKSAFTNMCGGITLSFNSSYPSFKPRIRFAFECDPIDVSVSAVSNLCNSSTVNHLTGNQPAVGHTGKWTLVSGSGNFTNDTHYNTELTNVGLGQNVYRWTITKTADGCSEYADLTVYNNTPTTPNAGTNATSCSPEYNLNGNIPEYGTGIWTVTGGSGIFDDNSLYNTVVSNMTGSNAGTENKFTWTITNNGCSLSDEVVVTYYFPPIASVTTSPLSGCYYDSGVTLTLNGNNPASLTPPATGQWSVVSGLGTFTNNTLYNTTLTNIGTPSNTYRWTLNRNGCSASANLVVNNSSPSLASAGSDQSISTSSTTMQANVPWQGTGTWTVSPAGPTFVDANSATTTVNNIAQNIAYTFTWTISNNGCVDTKDNVKIVRMDDLSGMVIQDNLTNDGSMIQTDDSYPFSMNGSNKYIYGGLSSTNTFTDTKLKVVGNITFYGEIDNGKFASTAVVAVGTFTIHNSRTYKNHDFSNTGTTNISTSSFFENSGDWINASSVVAHNTSTVVFNGNELQEITTHWDGTDNAFGHVSIAQTVATPGVDNGILLKDDMVLQSSSNLKLTKGLVVIKDDDKKLIVNNSASTAISGNFEQSWIYGTSSARCLRRYLADVNNQQYAFPVGSATYSNLALFTNNSIPDGTFFIDAYFRESPANINVDFPAPLEEETIDDYIRYSEIAEHGVWVLIPTGDIDANGTYDLELSLNGFDMSGATDNTFCILKRPIGELTGANWSVPLTTSEFIAQTVASNKATRKKITNFSEFGVGLGGSVLPIKLIDFKASCDSEKINITWVTSVEVNNHYFTLEKSLDGLHFSPITTIDGAGNSNQILNYSYSDADEQMVVYYRLSQTDFDGKSETFPIIAANCTNNNNSKHFFAVNPNPCTDYLFIHSSSEEPYSFELTSGIGEKIWKENQITSFKKNLLMKDLSPGLYVLKILDTQNQIYWFKIIKY